MRTSSGVGSNLWRRNSSGSYYPTVRAKIPLTGLVFYAPLWHPELGSSPFKTKDTNALSCTIVGGATGGNQGITLDGTDDKILVTETITLDLTANFTLAAWIKPTANLGGLACIMQKRTATNNYPYALFYNEAAGEVRLYSNAGSSANMNSTGTSALGTWLFVVVTRANTTINFFLNGSADAGNPQTLAQGSSDSTSGLRLGMSFNDANAFKGVVGDTLIHNRAISSTEIQSIYQATKWRYS